MKNAHVTTTTMDRVTAGTVTASAETVPSQPVMDQNETRALKATQHGSDSTPSIETTINPTLSIEQIKKHIDKQLHNDFARHFNYPYLAQRRNWQGKVRLGLRVEANGRLSHIHIIISSGYRVLDQAALDSLRQIAVIPDADHWLQGNTFDTVLPVEYRLIDS